MESQFPMSDVILGRPEMEFTVYIYIYKMDILISWLTFKLGVELQNFSGTWWGTESTWMGTVMQDWGNSCIWPHSLGCLQYFPTHSVSVFLFPYSTSLGWRISGAAGERYQSSTSRCGHLRSSSG